MNQEFPEVGQQSRRQFPVTSSEPPGSCVLVTAKRAEQLIKIRVEGQVGLAFNGVIDSFFEECRLQVFDANGQRA